MPDKARFLVHASADEMPSVGAAGSPPHTPLRDFLASLPGDPDIALVDTIGPTDRPHTAVIVTSPDKARALAQRFRGANNLLTIEPDRPLSLFDQGPEPIF